MDRKESQEKPIKVLVNRTASEEVPINLGLIGHNMKLRARVYAWVLVLCMAAGICASMLYYQMTRRPQTLTSVVTLRYTGPNSEYIAAKKKGDADALKRLSPTGPVSQLITPDGGPLDLSMLTSSTVLRGALSGLTLSEPVTLDQLRSNLTVTRILTEESNRTKEILAGLKDLKEKNVYTKFEEAEITYQNAFVVTLSNGFGDETSRVKRFLKEEELRYLMNRVLDAFNDALVKQWADLKLPEDEFSVIIADQQELPETLYSLNTALENLYEYCAARPEDVQSYRSSRTGLSLSDWMDSLRAVQEIRVDSLEAGVYAGGLMTNREAVRRFFRYRLSALQSELDQVKETIAANENLLKNYQNNEMQVTVKEGEGARGTRVTTAYYNNLVYQQQQAFEQAAALGLRIAEVESRLDRLQAVTALGSGAELEAAAAELETALAASREIYEGVRDHMEELFESPLYTIYADHSEPQDTGRSALRTLLVMLFLGAAAGAVIGIALWVLAALALEYRKHREARERAEGKEAAAE